MFSANRNLELTLHVDSSITATTRLSIFKNCFFLFHLALSSTLVVIEDANATSARPNVTIPSALDYLCRFGYLSTSTAAAESSGDTRISSMIDEREFDSALRSLQRMLALPVTGRLDSRTTAAMIAPRCGVPDFENTNNHHHHHHNSRNHHHHTIRRKYGARSRSRRYVLYGLNVKWHKNLLTWSITQRSRHFPEELAHQIFTRAFDVWSRASNGALRFAAIESTGKSTKSDIKLGFYTYEHSCGPANPFDGPDKVLAHAGSPPSGFAHFDDDEDFLAEEGKLFSVAVHEFGHLLGISHNNNTDSIMYPLYRNWGTNIAKLPADDRAAIRKLYGGSGEISAQPKKTPKTTKMATATPIPTTTEMATVSSREMDRCDEESSIPDAFLTIRNENIFIFKNNYFYWLFAEPNLRFLQIEPIVIGNYFYGFPRDNRTRIDAAYERASDGVIFLFSGSQFWSFEAGNRYRSGPNSILSHFDFPIHSRSIRVIETANFDSFTCARTDDGRIWQLISYGDSIRFESDDDSIRECLRAADHDHNYHNDRRDDYHDHDRREQWLWLTREQRLALDFWRETLRCQIKSENLIEAKRSNSSSSSSSSASLYPFYRTLSFVILIYLVFII